MAYSFASSPLFGPEFTFLPKTGNYKDIRSKMIKSIKLLCKKQHKCKVIRTRDKHGLAFKVQFPDGWWIEIAGDDPVVEVKSKPGTVEDFRARKNIFEDFVFNNAAKHNAFPHRVTGGGHINIGMESAFQDNSLKFRNYIVDQANHPELAYGIMGSSKANSPSIASLPLKNQKRFQAIIKEFDANPTTIDELILRIEKEVYTNNPEGWNPKYYQNHRYLNAKKTTAVKLRRLEARGVRPQESFDMFLLEIEFLQKRMDHLNQLATPVKLSIPEHHKASPGQKKWLFQKMVSEMGLDPETYIQIAPIEIREAKPIQTYKSFNEANPSSQSLKDIQQQISLKLNELGNDRSGIFHREYKKINVNKGQLNPSPRVLSKLEYELIKKGTKQRANALMAFYKDVVSKKYKAEEDGIIPKGLSRRLLKKNNLDQAHEFMSLENASFIYAPDIARDSSGNLFIIEDNVGNPGGIADSFNAKDDFLKLMPEFQDLLSNNLEFDFGSHIAKILKKKCIGKENCYTAFMIHSQNKAYEKKLITSLKKEGVLIFTEEDAHYFQSTAEGTFVKYQGENGKIDLRRIGGMYIKNIEMSFWKKKFKYSWEAFKNGNIGLLGHHHTEFLSDKELGKYTNQLIEYYLNEKPILKSPKTIIFRGIDKDNNNFLKQETLNSVFDNIADWVIKDTTGKQGSSVWIGRNLQEHEIKDLKQKVAKNPAIYIADEFIPMSIYNDHYVDLRSFAVVDKDEARVSNHIWSRAIETSGDGKTNISQNANRLPVFIEEIDTTSNIKSKTEVSVIVQKLSSDRNKKIQSLTNLRFLDYIPPTTLFISDLPLKNQYLPAATPTEVVKELIRRNNPQLYKDFYQVTLGAMKEKKALDYIDALIELNPPYSKNFYIKLLNINIDNSSYQSLKIKILENLASYKNEKKIKQALIKLSIKETKKMRLSKVPEKIIKMYADRSLDLLDFYKFLSKSKINLHLTVHQKRLELLVYDLYKYRDNVQVHHILATIDKKYPEFIASLKKEKALSSFPSFSIPQQKCLNSILGQKLLIMTN